MSAADNRRDAGGSAEVADVAVDNGILLVARALLAEREHALKVVGCGAAGRRRRNGLESGDRGGRLSTRSRGSHICTLPRTYLLWDEYD